MEGASILFRHLPTAAINADVFVDAEWSSFGAGTIFPLVGISFYVKYNGYGWLYSALHSQIEKIRV